MELPTEENPVTVVEGDCLDVLRELPDGCVDAVVTSPPYGIGKDYEKGQTTLDFEYLLKRFIAQSARVVTPQGYVAININDRLCGSDERGGVVPVLPIIDAEAVRQGLILFDRRIWVKDCAWANNPWIGGSIKSVDEFEYLFIYRRTGHTARLGRIVRFIAAARDRAGLSNADIDSHFGFNGMAGHWTAMHKCAAAPTVDQWRVLKSLLKAGDDIDTDIARECRRERERLAQDEWSTWGSRGVWQIPSVRSNDRHSAQFPVELPRRLIRLLTHPGDLILDPFAGSGTTAEAAAFEGRRCILIEKEPAYAKICRERVAKVLDRGLFADV